MLEHRCSSHAFVFRRMGNAFTLIELIVVMTIVSLMLGAAVPIFNSTLAKTRADSVIEEVAMAFRLANQKSVFTQNKHDVVIDFRKNQYWLEYLQPGKISKKLKMRPDEVRVLTGDFQFLLIYYPDKDDTETRHKSRISFFPDGTATDTIVFLGRPTNGGAQNYDPLFALEIRGGDGRVRVLTEEERGDYDYLL